ncbi:MAG: FGGY family carbohydrate kinase, partial [Planctomycetales bacterium]
PNNAETTTPADKKQGRSEWSAPRILQVARDNCKEVALALGDRAAEIAGNGLTGQQHGVVIIDDDLQPLTPFINWQDRRAEDPLGPGQPTCLQRARERLGQDAPRRAGCSLAAGYLGATLYWMRLHDALPGRGSACFIMDFVAASLTGTKPICEPTAAASSGLLDLRERNWDRSSLQSLGLRESLFPEIREAGSSLGTLSQAASAEIMCPAGTPVFIGLGDHQASVLGSVAEPAETVLVNVGTGGQVAAFVKDFRYQPPLETRPYPGSGFLLVNAGLCGGRSQAALERFFRDVGAAVFDQETEGRLFARMNELAAKAPPGSDGLRCEPFFTGTRAEPERRAVWSGISAENFTPGHWTRALLEGMARTFREGFELIQAAAEKNFTRLVGSGNGLRDNPVLAQAVADEFGMPLRVPTHREEAAFGAALHAGIGAGVFPHARAAGTLIRYHTISRPAD